MTREDFLNCSCHSALKGPTTPHTCCAYNRLDLQHSTRPCPRLTPRLALLFLTLFSVAMLAFPRILRLAIFPHSHQAAADRNAPQSPHAIDGHQPVVFLKGDGTFRRRPGTRKQSLGDALEGTVGILAPSCFSFLLPDCRETLVKPSTMMVLPRAWSDHRN